MTRAEHALEVELGPSRWQVSAAAAPPAECELTPAIGSRVGPVRFASPIDAFTYGEHRITAPSQPKPIRQFTGRITADGSSGNPRNPTATTSTPTGSALGESRHREGDGGAL